MPLMNRLRHNAYLCHNSRMRPLTRFLTAALCLIALPAQAELQPLVDVATETEILNTSPATGDQPAYASCVRMFFGIAKDRRGWRVRAAQQDCPQIPYCSLQLWLGSMHADGGNEVLIWTGLVPPGAHALQLAANLPQDVTRAPMGSFACTASSPSN